MNMTSNQLSSDLGRSDKMFVAALEPAPLAITIVDSQLRVRAMNQRARAALGDASPPIGRDLGDHLRDLWPEPLASEVLARYRHTLATGEAYIASTLTETRATSNRIESYEWQLHRIRMPDGGFGVACYFHDVTRVHQAEAFVAAAAHRDAFLLALNDRLRSLYEPNAIMQAAAEVLSRELDLPQAGYAEVAPDGEVFAVGDGYTDGRLPEYRGQYRFSDFGDFGAVLREGHDLLIEDVRADPRGPAGGSEMVRVFQLIAAAGIPLVKNGRLVAFFYAVDTKPRAWMPWERQLIREVAERTWAAVERARAENETRDRERQFEAVLEQSPLGVFLLDADFRILQANPAALAVFGVPNANGRDFHEILEVWELEQAEAILERFRHTLETGESFAVPEFSARRRDLGFREHYEWRIDRIPLPHDRCGVVCYFREISAAVRAREVIAATEARYRTLFESIDEGFAMLDVLFEGDRPVDIGLLETNSSFDRHTGTTGLSGHRIREFYPDFDPWWLERIGHVARTGESARIEHRVDVLGRWFDVYASRVGDEGSRRVAVVFNDITERKRTEAALRASEARLQLALEASNMGTFVWHVQDDRVESDARVPRLVGSPEGWVLDVAAVRSGWIHPEDRERYQAAVQAATDPNGAGTLRDDFRVVHGDGSVHWLAITAQTLFEHTPRRAERLVGTLADITERKTIEEALREREERLRDGDRRKDEFLAILAHELRNPLGPIRTGLELIRLAGHDSDAVERVRLMMERQVSHMVRLIDDLLDVSRITSGKIRLQRQPASLATMVHTAVDANRAAFTERHIEFRAVLPDAPVLLDVDPTRFVQIVSNLLNNAVKFTSAGGRIEIQAQLDPPFLRLTVADSGIGISRVLLPRVFDLFAQGEESSTSQTGLGIGLALARRLVEMHGGTIDAESPGPGLGSTFTIRMPLATGPVATATPKPTLPPAQLRRRVVVIDDNVDAADSLKMFVTALGGECRVAYDGERGLMQVIEFKPHLILLDIGMPRIDGYETCRRIRKQLGATVVIVAISGWGQERDKLASRKAGFDAHLTKPVDPVLLKSLLASSRDS